MVQSLEGGIVLEMNVREGDIVSAGQSLATLDPVLARSTVEETTVRIRAMSATAARLEAEINAEPDISFPADVDTVPSIASRERALFASRRKSLNERLIPANGTHDPFPYPLAAGASAGRKSS